MELNEIKKALYKTNVNAFLRRANNTGLHYEAFIGTEAKVSFIIPLNDFGDATFNWQEPAKLLIRWIVL